MPRAILMPLVNSPFALGEAQACAESFADPDERARELIGEGHRWMDLRRTTRPAIVKTYKDRTYTLNANDARYTLPFPQSAIDSNPELND